MNDDERIKLAEKLDSDLDDFINSLEKKRYSDGWSEDTWKQEIDKHPFFMKRVPDPGEEVHPLYEGLQQLKFDTELNTPEELAEKYKEDGNYWMKHKKYRIAIMSYTEGLQQKNNENNDLIASLYNNRSAAQFFLKNFRSSYLDARQAIKYKNDYEKAKIRMLKCNMELQKYEDVCSDAEQFLIQDPTSKQFIEIQKEAFVKKTEKKRDQRKSQMNEKKKRQEFQALVQALIQRQVKFEELELKNQKLSELLSIDIIRPTIEPLESTPVSLDRHGIIYWPIVFCYPEYKITDIQQQVHEMETIYECLQDLFNTDENKVHNYKNPNEMAVYYENRMKRIYIEVDLVKTIKNIIFEDMFLVFNGYLTFYVLPRGSNTERNFINYK